MQEVKQNTDTCLNDACDGIEGALAGIVVLYHPQEGVIDNIRTYLPYLRVLYVVDNSSSTKQSSVIEALLVYPNVEFLHSGGTNLGIAKALNMGLEKATMAGYEWLLTMDQDSRFRPEQAQRFFSAFSGLRKNGLAIISPCHHPVAFSGPCEFRAPDIVWTSGNLVNVRIAQEAGMFDEGYFIDSVDHEFCLRLRSKGYGIRQATNCFLDHELGQDRLVGFMKRKRRQFHSPKRLYFMIRNGLCLEDAYRLLFPEFIAECRGQIRTEMIRAMKYSNERRRYIYYGLRAWLDYRRGIMGNQVDL